MTYDIHGQNKRKINNLYPILPTNGFLMALEKREKENKVKVLMLNYASKPLNSNRCGRIGNGEHQELMTFLFFLLCPQSPVRPAHACQIPLFWKDKSRNNVVSPIHVLRIH